MVTTAQRDASSNEDLRTHRDCIHVWPLHPASLSSRGHNKTTQAGSFKQQKGVLRVPTANRSGAGDSASEGALGCRHLLLLMSAGNTKRVLVSLPFLIRTLI